VVIKVATGDRNADGIVIRPAAPGDEEALAHVHVRAWQTAYRGILPDAFLDGLDVATRVQRWRSRIEMPGPGEFSFVAEAADDAGAASIVGFVGGGPEREGLVGTDGIAYDGEVYAIYLLAEWRGKGVGHRLMAASVSALLGDGRNSVVIWVLAGNANARRFYEALGGLAIAERSVTIGQYELPEVAYGYPDAGRLLAAASRANL
jgi:GNAT superfamily N-acetyltransferase